MKFLIVLAVIAVAAAVPLNRISASEIDEIISAINSPSTDPATAAALQQMLHDLLGGHGLDDISAGPAIIDETPALIDTNPALVEEHEDIAVGPALIEEHEDISVGPAIIEDQPASIKSPLVQVIINVDASANDVTVDQVYNPENPALIPSPVEIIDGSQPELIPDNVNVIENEIIPDPITIVENPKPELEVENINIDTPLIPDGAVMLPDILN
ncbi:uncharacterized protein LOC123716204 isoform X3 [Pieris brassicae]|uniref:uncharacterized protein LOC123716204 isoform X2 n=1 Tax=Pieris brassicae TaxID=7116 RepID=UPI001E661DF1|nr:uncharacterized protein LOC123716204 isoform X2 [Pieris brassicae]XP_045527785.1 uncharacterized protein LOC123716204 isoform X3 [Pieris brassicae]